MSPLLAESTQSDEIDLSGYGLALLRGWRLILAVGILAVLLNVLFTHFLKSPVYVSSSTLLIENKGRKAVGGVILVDTYPPNPANMATEVRRLASYDLLKPIVVELDLAKDPEFSFGVSSELTTEEKHVAAYKNLLDRIEVESRVDTNLIDLKVRSKNQAKAIKIADVILKHYLSVQTKVFFETFSELGPETDALFADPAWVTLELEKLAEQIDALRTQDQLSQLERIHGLENISNSTILLYAYYLSTFEENRYGPQFQLFDSQIFSSVLVPPYINNPAESVWSVNAIIFSFFLGLFAGSFLVLLGSMRRGRICTENHLALRYGIPVSGRLKSKDDATQIQNTAMLRDSLLLSGTDHHSILVLNAPGRKSKSTLSAPLAYRFAAAGKKTLIISVTAFSEAKPVFAVPELEKGNSLDAAIVAGDDFDILQMAQTVDEARDIFPSTTFLTFLSNAKERYDVIIFAAEDKDSAQIVTPLHRESTNILVNCDEKTTYERDLTALLRHLPVQSGKISGVFWK